MANPAKFLSEVRTEISRITWPTRREVTTTTIMVVIMATLFAVFFLIVDLLIRFGLNGILGAFG